MTALRLTAITVLLAASGMIATAKSKTNPPNVTSKMAAKEASSAKPRISASQAGDIARKAIKGDQLYGITLNKANGRLAYEVEVLAKASHLKLVKLDGTTGKVLQVEDEGLVLGSWTFDDDNVGTLPDKWVIKQNNSTKALANWTVIAFPDAPTPPNVLSVRSENDNATFNLAMAAGTSFKDVDIRMQIRANAGQTDQGGGIIWRAKDENNYYVCRINPLEPNCRVYEVESGKRQQLQSAEVKTETGKWHTIRVVMVDDRITCYLDDQKLFDVNDDTFADPGMIGLWSKADASSSFDNLLVLQAGRPGPPTAPAE